MANQNAFFPAFVRGTEVEQVVLTVDDPEEPSDGDAITAILNELTEQDANWLKCIK